MSSLAPNDDVQNLKLPGAQISLKAGYAGVLGPHRVLLANRRRLTTAVLLQ